MKKLMLTCAFMLAACGGGAKKQQTTNPDPNTSVSNTDATGAGSATTTGEGQPCEQEIAMVCPDGQIDGCLKQPAEGTTHACVAK